MKIVIGLGNLEKKYLGTRHNIGFMVVDRIAYERNLQYQSSKHHAIIAEDMLDGEKFLLVKPTTLMNRSGNAVRSLVDFYKIDNFQDILIISDDLNIEVGDIRLRDSGGHGGHNGLRDITSKIGSSDYPRMRIGIGFSDPRQWSSYVLSSFKVSEHKIIEAAILDASDTILKWLEGDFKKAQNFLANI